MGYETRPAHSSCSGCRFGRAASGSGRRLVGRRCVRAGFGLRRQPREFRLAEVTYLIPDWSSCPLWPPAQVLLCRVPVGHGSQ